MVSRAPHAWAVAGSVDGPPPPAALVATRSSLAKGAPIASLISAAGAIAAQLTAGPVRRASRAASRRSSGSSLLARLAEPEPHLRAALEDSPVVGELVDDP